MTTSDATVLDYGATRERSALATFAIQTVAIFIDAYRELNAKKLFWITLILSLLVVVAFAFVGINEQGISIFGKTWPGAWNTSLIPRETFYKFLFMQLAIPYWLAFAASVLALLSVGSVFPDFLVGGSIDLYLSKPIGRLRLFLTKYIAGLMFVGLQVLCFALGSFLVIGIRGGAWEVGIFLAVPLVVLFFSYIYCVCVLLGILTRSTLASLLVALLFWFMLFIMNSADSSLLVFKTMQQQSLARADQTLSFYQRLIDQQKSRPTTQQSAGMISNYEFQMKKPAEDREKFQSAVTQLTWWHNLVTSIKAPLPKTSETVSLMSRWLVEPDAITRAERESQEQHRQRRQARLAAMGATRPSDRIEPDDADVQQEVMAELTGRRAARIIGTSVAFEVVVLAVAAWIFCRRDF
jgi:ABC-type transport system involved in multi-copper enzyme maturation permease subunit